VSAGHCMNGVIVCDAMEVDDLEWNERKISRTCLDQVGMQISNWAKQPGHLASGENVQTENALCI
jgi:hypothetical protein